jgi:hypothetical protein
MTTETKSTLPTDSRSESSHTPGPWIAYPETVKVGRNPVCNRIAVLALDEDGPCGHVDFSDANANLICAAPDLLAAARKAVSLILSYSDSGNILDELEKAIAKAEGRS